MTALARRIAQVFAGAAVATERARSLGPQFTLKKCGKHDDVFGHARTRPNELEPVQVGHGPP